MATTFLEGKGLEVLPAKLRDSFFLQMSPVVYAIKLKYKKPSKKNDKDEIPSAKGKGKGKGKGKVTLGPEDSELFLTGFCVSKDGTIWTSLYVVDDREVKKVQVLYDGVWKTVDRGHEYKQYGVCALTPRKKKRPQSFQFAEIGGGLPPRILQEVIIIFEKGSFAIGHITHRNFATGGFRPKRKSENEALEYEEFYEVNMGTSHVGAYGAPVFDPCGRIFGMIVGFEEDIAIVVKLCSVEEMESLSPSSE